MNLLINSTVVAGRYVLHGDDKYRAARWRALRNFLKRGEREGASMCVCTMAMRECRYTVADFFLIGVIKA